MGWLAQHLETFVKPVLGYVPIKSTDYQRFFVPSEMAVIKNMWRVAKCESKRLGKPLLLAGRDVFVFEILARRENFPTTFRPDISRLTVNHVTEDYSGYYLFDTGFMGSIPRALNITDYVMASSNSLGPFRGHRLLNHDTNQAFPRMTGARSLALKIERTPKYWRTAFWRSYCYCTVPAPMTGSSGRSYCTVCGQEVTTSDRKTGIGQEFQPTDEFLRAALLTIEIYTDSSPTFTEHDSVIRKPRSYWDYLG